VLLVIMVAPNGFGMGSSVVVMVRECVPLVNWRLVFCAEVFLVLDTEVDNGLFGLAPEAFVVGMSGALVAKSLIGAVLRDATEYSEQSGTCERRHRDALAGARTAPCRGKSCG
jgi:hypothetical protein